MKKNFAIYFAICTLLFAGVSCSDDETQTQLSPYASIKSFALNDIYIPFHDVTAEEEDTIVEKLVSGDEFAFIIDHKEKVVYNADSLTYGTNLKKLTATISCQGIAYRYDADDADYVYFSSSDSIDFTSPVRVRVTSTDGSYNNYYTITVNAHHVDPDLLVWNNYPADELIGLAPIRILEREDNLYLFAENADGENIVAISPIESDFSWSIGSVNLKNGSLASVQLFGDKFYMLADGDLYSSDDAKEWALTAEGYDFIVLSAVSDNGTKMWAANADNLLLTTDGETFTITEPLPAEFPIYDCNGHSYALATNSNIYRTVVVGRANEEIGSEVFVWSKLSTEEEWCPYKVDNDDYKCPSFENLAVLHYDDALYAFGGTAVADDEELLSFGKFYVSKDNGIAWKACDDYGITLPAELEGNDTQFATTVITGNYIVIATDGMVWKGRINRLGF